MCKWSPIIDSRHPWYWPETQDERRRRIRVSVFAYAYEVLGRPLVPDNVFDELARSVRPFLFTHHPVMDAFFRTEFRPYTGAWVWRHPEKSRLAGICLNLHETPPVRP